MIENKIFEGKICPKCGKYDGVSKVEYETTKEIHHVCCRCKITIEKYKEQEANDE